MMAIARMKTTRIKINSIVVKEMNCAFKRKDSVVMKYFKDEQTK